jgi:hypothetical protein
MLETLEHRMELAASQERFADAAALKKEVELLQHEDTVRSLRQVGAPLRAPRAGACLAAARSLPASITLVSVGGGAGAGARAHGAGRRAPLGVAEQPHARSEMQRFPSVVCLAGCAVKMPMQAHEV